MDDAGVDAQPVEREESLVEFLGRVALFAGAPPKSMEITADVVRPRRFAPDTVLFREGDAGDAVYILRRGQVKLSSIDLDGHEKTLAMLSPPEFFGEMALLDEPIRSASALTVTEVEALLLFRDDWRKLMERFPQVGLNVTNTLSRRLRGMHDEARVLSYKDARGRVAYALLRLCRTGIAERTAANSAIVRLTHQELASMAGSSRETVTRALKSLEEEAVIETQPKEIHVVDIEGLEEILHGVR